MITWLGQYRLGLSLFKGRTGFHPGDWQLQTALIGEDPAIVLHALQIVKDYRQFRKLIMALPHKEQQIPWEAPEMAVSLLIRIESLPAFIFEAGASLLKIIYIFDRMSKPKYTASQVYALWMKKKEDFQRRQAALEQLVIAKQSDPPATIVQKMDRMVVVYCAPYYETRPAFVRVMALWRDIVANFKEVQDRAELARILVTFYIDFVCDMIIACSFGSRDVPENFVFITYPGAPPEKPEYEYNP